MEAVLSDEKVPVDIQNMKPIHKITGDQYLNIRLNLKLCLFLPFHGLLVMSEQSLAFPEFFGVHDSSAVSFVDLHVGMQHFVVNNERNKITRCVLPVESRTDSYGIGVPAVASEGPSSRSISRGLCSPGDGAA